MPLPNQPERGGEWVWGRLTVASTTPPLPPTRRATTTTLTMTMTLTTTRVTTTTQNCSSNTANSPTNQATDQLIDQKTDQQSNNIIIFYQGTTCNKPLRRVVSIFRTIFFSLISFLQFEPKFKQKKPPKSRLVGFGLWMRFFCCIFLKFSNYLSVCMTLSGKNFVVSVVSLSAVGCRYGH